MMLQRHVQSKNPFWGPNAQMWQSLFMMALFALIVHVITMMDWATHLPAAIASMLSVWSVYCIGRRTGHHKIGMLAAWMLITTFCFIFWARIVSADIFHLTGILLTVAWYFEYRHAPRVWHYAVFFSLICLFFLCRDWLGGMAIALVLLPDLLIAHHWRDHFNASLIKGFLISTLFWGSLYLMTHVLNNPLFLREPFNTYWENYSHYFNQSPSFLPSYTTLIYLPAYLFPWFLFFIPALVHDVRHWNFLTLGARWSFWATMLLFMTSVLLPGYSVAATLVIAPFAILMTAHWIGEDNFKHRRTRYALYTTIFFLILLLCYFIIF